MEIILELLGNLFGVGLGHEIWISRVWIFGLSTCRNRSPNLLHPRQNQRQCRQPTALAKKVE